MDSSTDHTLNDEYHDQINSIDYQDYKDNEEEAKITEQKRAIRNKRIVLKIHDILLRKASDIELPDTYLKPRD